VGLAIDFVGRPLIFGNLLSGTGMRGKGAFISNRHRIPQVNLQFLTRVIFMHCL
jgi:hypothetical protein